ncbi:hypothetical protein K491DRAFT_339387 [Lophiostoma macrostomum CBS 122681]|uniref:Uncharacterized protein n=1 Tax=Lophiostoma macrostomum CBS 122681 TaxID=1314788 RepID=A0A6A6TSX6_9PLEO|nr:hypothetical protein K491DRAFT_339387 [Lophiostoma macrostomum CBS 122681]
MLVLVVVVVVVVYAYTHIRTARGYQMSRIHEQAHAKRTAWRGGDFLKVRPCSATRIPSACDRECMYRSASRASLPILHFRDFIYHVLGDAGKQKTVFGHPYSQIAKPWPTVDECMRGGEVRSG